MMTLSTGADGVYPNFPASMLWKMHDDSADAVIVVSDSLYVLYVNKSARQLFNIDDTQFGDHRSGAQKLIDVAPRFATDPLHSHLSRVLSGQIEESCPFYSLDHGAWFEAHMLPIAFGDGSFCCITIRMAEDQYALIRSLQDQNQSLQRLHERLVESEERYRSLKRNNPDGICSIDLKGRIESVNPSLTKLLGYSETEFQSMTWYDFVSEGDLPRIVQNLHMVDSDRGLQNPGVPAGSDLHLQHKDGHIIPVQYSVVPILVQGDRTGYFVIIKDMSAQRRSEEAIIQSEKLKAVGELAAGVAHEIRNPLTTVIGFTQMMLATGRSLDNEHVELMLSELQRAEEIVSDLVALAKPNLARREEVDLRQVVQEVAGLMNAEAHLHNVHISVEVCPRPVPIRCHPAQVKQVLVHLMKNAVEASFEGGSVRVRLEVVAQDAVLIVEDEGVGMTAHELSKIGSPFYTTKRGGTGLGVMVSQRIVELHRGKVHIESEAGVGTSVEVRLPGLAQEA